MPLVADLGLKEGGLDEPPPKSLWKDRLKSCG